MRRLNFMFTVCNMFGLPSYLRESAAVAVCVGAWRNSSTCYVLPTSHHRDTVVSGARKLSYKGSAKRFIATFPWIRWISTLSRNFLMFMQTSEMLHNYSIH